MTIFQTILLLSLLSFTTSTTIATIGKDLCNCVCVRDALSAFGIYICNVRGALYSIANDVICILLDKFCFLVAGILIIMASEEVTFTSGYAMRWYAKQKELKTPLFDENTNRFTVEIKGEYDCIIYLLLCFIIQRINIYSIVVDSMTIGVKVSNRFPESRYCCAIY